MHPPDVGLERWNATIGAWNRAFGGGSIDTAVLPGPPSCVYSFATHGVAASRASIRAVDQRDLP